MHDRLWQQCLAQARERERKAYANAPRPAPVYYDGLTEEQWAQNDREAASLDHYAREIRR